MGSGGLKLIFFKGIYLQILEKEETTLYCPNKTYPWAVLVVSLRFLISYKAWLLTAL